MGFVQVKVGVSKFTDTFFFILCCLQMHLFPFITFTSGLRLLLWTAFSCSSRKRHLHWWLLVRNTHLAADRATLFMRQAGQGSALKHNSCSLARLTFASLGHGNSRAGRRRGQAPFTQLFVFSSQDAGATRFCDEREGSDRERRRKER